MAAGGEPAAATETESMTTVKCLVWDLDDTLWQGTLLERDELAVSSVVREVVKDLDARGILQSIASRNEPDQAWARLEELGLAEYFVLPQIGWGRKSDAVRAIADQLNFTHRTMAFIDDQPAERAEVAFHLPQVRCYPAEQAASLLGRPEFTTPVVTVDARRRREMYQAGFRRETAWAEHSGADQDFMRSLQMMLRISRAGDDELSRLDELTLRTSQMNATGVHYPDSVLRALLTDPAHEVLALTLTDRFGPHGAVGVVLLARHPACWHLKLLATSCRVVNFGVGTTLLRWLTDRAEAASVHLVADFRRADRNRIMEIAYRFAGFAAPDGCGCGAALPATADSGVERLHLVPRRLSPPSTMTVLGPELTDHRSADDAADPEMRWA